VLRSVLSPRPAHANGARLHLRRAILLRGIARTTTAGRMLRGCRVRVRSGPTNVVHRAGVISGQRQSALERRPGAECSSSAAAMTTRSGGTDVGRIVLSGTAEVCSEHVVAVDENAPNKPTHKPLHHAKLERELEIVRRSRYPARARSSPHCRPMSSSNAVSTSRPRVKRRFRHCCRRSRTAGASRSPSCAAAAGGVRSSRRERRSCLSVSADMASAVWRLGRVGCTALVRFSHQAAFVSTTSPSDEGMGTGSPCSRRLSM